MALSKEQSQAEFCKRERFVVGIENGVSGSFTGGNHYLNILEIELCCIYDNDHIEKVLNGLSTNLVLEELRMSSCNMSMNSSKILADLLKSSQTIYRLSIQGGVIRREAIALVIEALKESSSIQYLEFRETGMGNKGAQAVAELLKVNKSVRSLGIYERSIDHDGIKEIAMALKDNKSVSSFTCRFDQRKGDLGTHSFGKMLKQNKHLIRLDLGNNRIGNLGAKCLAASLKFNGCLRELNLRDNLISNVGAVALSDALKVNTSLCCVNVGRNRIKSIGKFSFAKAALLSHSIRSLAVDSWHVWIYDGR